MVRMPYKDDPEADPPLQPRYSDDPPAAGPPMAAFYTDDPFRTRLDRRHDDWGIEGGGSESVGIVGSAHANAFAASPSAATSRLPFAA